MQYPTLKVVFDRKKIATKNKTGLVQIEVLSDRKRKWISTRVKVYSGQWNKSRMVVGRMDAESLNLSIQGQLGSIQNWINDLRRKREVFDFDKLSAFLKTATTTSNNFIEYLEKRIDERTDIRPNTKKGHYTLVNSLKSFGRIIAFSDLTRQKLSAYDAWLHEQNYEQSTIHAYHKSLKVYINDAIRREIIKENPYASIKIERGKSGLRKYLSDGELERVRQARMLTPALERVRDLFVFQCFTGLAYADLAKFDFADVVERNGRFVVHDTRQKSGEDFYIVLLSPALEVLRKYDFKLPLMSSQKYNANLKVVANTAGIDVSLTSHMARHTFAVYCLNHGVPIETLAKMMGHTDIKTTQLYAKIANTTVEAAFDRLERQLTDK